MGITRISRGLLRLGTTVIWLLLVAAGAEAVELRFTRFDQEPALQQNKVYDIIEDRQGFLWLGTYNGLYRYDGYSFILFQADEPGGESVPTGPARRLFIDHTGMIWVAIQANGVAILDPATGKCRHLRHDAARPGSISSNTMHGFEEDKKGNIWIFNSNSGIDCWDRKTGKIRHYDESKGLPSKEVLAWLYNEGALWISTRAGLCSYDPGTDRFTKLDLGIKLDYVSWFYRDRSGMVWLSLEKEIIKYDPHKKKGYTLLKTDPQRYTSEKRFYEDRTGMMWITTYRQGLLTYKDGKFHNYLYNHSDPLSLPGNDVSSVYIDRDDNVWIGTDNGLAKINAIQRGIDHYRCIPGQKNSLNTGEVRSVYIDRKGNKWIGTVSGGLNLISPEGLYSVFSPEKESLHSYGANVINNINEDSRGNLLLSTSAGLYSFNPGSRKFSLLLKKFGPHDLSAWSVYEDPDHILWIGTRRNGLLSLDPASGEVKQHNEIVSGNREEFSVWRIYRDNDGMIWLGTSEGLKKVTLDRRKVNSTNYLQNLQAENSLHGENIFHMHDDGEGSLWIATTDGGLNRLSKKTGAFRHFTMRDGLPSNVISGILEDGQHRLWISTLRGICVFDRNTEKVITRFNKGDGLQGNRFNFGCCYKTKEGLMFFGGYNGVNAFFPDALISNGLPPRLALLSFKVLYQEMKNDLLADSIIVLPYNQNTISVEYACLDFTNPRNNTYTYMLEGGSNEWVSTGDRNYMQFSGLSPGNYTFRVMALNGFSLGSNTLSYRIIIRPPFWRTWPFYIMCSIIALSMLGLGLYLWLRHKNMERRRIQSELAALRSQLDSHFVFNSLSSLQHFITVQQHEMALKYLSKFARLMRLILENSRRELISLAEEMEFLELYCYMQNLRCDDRIQFEISSDPQLDRKKTRIPSMLLQPLIENSIIHGQVDKVAGGKVQISFRKKGDYVTCTVEDNGIGREKAAYNKGQANIRKNSMGIHMILERLAVLRDLFPNKTGFDITDMKDRAGEACGTRIDITIPYLSL